MSQAQFRDEMYVFELDWYLRGVVLNPPIQMRPQSVFTKPSMFTFAPRALKMYQVQKVALVGLACLLFFGAQLCHAWTMTIGIAAACSLVTLMAESCLRKDDNRNQNWMHPIDKRELVLTVALRISLAIITVSMMTACGALPLQAVAGPIIAGNLRIIFLCTLVAPIAEEILFRGFIQERLEDVITLVDRYICRLSENTKKWMSPLVTSLFFGAIHITGGQLAHNKNAHKFFVFGMLSFFGFSLAVLKHIDRSLLSPIASHCAQNVGYTLGLLMNRRR